MQVERIRPAELEGDELWRCNGEYVPAEAYDKLEAALRKIAAPTYGTELTDTDEQRADCYWTHLQRFQDIARKALGG